MLTGATIIFERRTPQVNSRALENFVRAAARAAGLCGKVNVLIAADSQIRRLNRRFRKKDVSTDVLSFPVRTPADGLAGDIAISMDSAARSARSLGHSLPEEIQILVLHGILHLAGFNHENDHGEMSRKEAALRKKFSLPLALIERAAGRTAKLTSVTRSQRVINKQNSRMTGRGRKSGPYRRSRT
jgi:probable rRNA maturation factor